jgi:hypothetical protein
MPAKRSAVDEGRRADAHAATDALLIGGAPARDREAPTVAPTAMGKSPPRVVGLLLGAALAVTTSLIGVQAIAAGANTAQDATESAVMNAAQKILADYLRMIPEGMELDHGFNGRNEFAEATIAQPYQVFGLAADGTIASLDVWRVPVMVRGEFRMLVDVRKGEGGYEPFAFGTAPLAAELGVIEQDVHGGTAARSTRHKSIILVLPNLAEFASYDLDPGQAKDLDQLRLRPLPSAAQAFSLKAERLRASGVPVGSSTAGKSNEFSISDILLLLQE